MVTRYNAARSGRGADRLARFNGVEEVGGSNPLAPTTKTGALGSCFCFSCVYSNLFDIAICNIAIDEEIPKHHNNNRNG